MITQRPWLFWLLVIFLVLSIAEMIIGQTLSLFDYDLTVALGLQESITKVGRFGVEVNLAFAGADSFVYIPLMIASLVGLWQKKQWALLTTAAIAGISSYWSTTIALMFILLPGTDGYNYQPSMVTIIFVAVYLVMGWTILGLLIWQGKEAS
jgi:hypothetical protein